MARAGLWVALLLTGPALAAAQLSGLTLSSLGSTAGCLTNVTVEAASYLSCVAAAGADVHQQCGCLEAFNSSESVDLCRYHASTSLQIRAVMHTSARCRGVASDLNCMQEVAKATANYPRCMAQAGMDMDQQCGCIDLLNESLAHCMDTPSAAQSINAIVGATQPQCEAMASSMGCARLAGSAAYRYPICYNEAGGDQYLHCACLEEVNVTLGDCLERDDINSQVQRFLGSSNADCGSFACENQVGEALINYEACVEGLNSTAAFGRTPSRDCACKSAFEAEAGGCAGHPDVQAQVAEVLANNSCAQARPVLAHSAMPSTSRHDAPSVPSDLIIALVVTLVTGVVIMVLCCWCLFWSTPERGGKRRKQKDVAEEDRRPLQDPEALSLPPNSARSGTSQPMLANLSPSPSRSSSAASSQREPALPGRGSRRPSYQPAGYAVPAPQGYAVPVPVPQAYVAPAQRAYSYTAAGPM